MGQALSISARGGSIFSRTKYANKDLGVKLDHVVGDDNQRMSARKLNNSIQRKTEAAIYFYGKNTSRSQARAESAPQKKRTNPDRNTRSPATTSASNFPLWMRGVRRCIVEMAMRLVKGDRVVLVLPTGDEGSSTQKTFEEYRKWAANSKGDAKWFYELGGKQYLALPGEVHANNKGSDIVCGIVGESDAINLIEQNNRKPKASRLKFDTSKRARRGLCGHSGPASCPNTKRSRALFLYPPPRNHRSLHNRANAWPLVGEKGGAHALF